MTYLLRIRHEGGDNLFAAPSNNAESQQFKIKNTILYEKRI
jgi:hypothetical protein